LALYYLETSALVKLYIREAGTEQLLRLVSRRANRIEKHLETKFLRQVLNDSVLEAATKLIDRYPLRAYDAVQLAGCLILKAMSGKDDPVFVCAVSDGEWRVAPPSSTSL
jgi:predicted nucleic acid-binding protein